MPPFPPLPPPSPNPGGSFADASAIAQLGSLQLTVNATDLGAVAGSVASIVVATPTPAVASAALDALGAVVGAPASTANTASQPAVAAAVAVALTRLGTASLNDSAVTDKAAALLQSMSDTFDLRNTTQGPAVTNSIVAGVAGLAGASVGTSAGGGSASALLDVLSSVAGGSLPMGNATANLYASGMSGLLNGAAGSAAYVGAAQAAGGAVTALAANLRSGVGGTCADAAPLVVESEAVNMTISPCLSGSALAEGFTSPGSSAVVNPLPAAVVLGLTGSDGGSATAVFYTLDFDPHLGLANTTGVMHLSFTNADGTPAVVNGSSLITFTLPGVVLPTGTVAVAQFWDGSAYDTLGCVAFPNPAPPGVNISWIPDFTVADASHIAFAWTLDASSPVMDGCVQVLLNCSDEDTRSQLVSFSPHLSIGDPVIGCDELGDGPHRVLVGSYCSLWQRNASGCFWDVRTQQFQGAGCIAVDYTEMATTHLTDFIGASKPSLAVASVSDIAGLRPDDLVRLRVLIYVVAGTFAVTQVVSFALSFADRSQQSAASSRCVSPALGFAALPPDEGDACDEVWTWRLTQEPVATTSGVAAVRGSAVEAAGLVGIPYVRLACALPPAFLGGTCTPLSALGLQRTDARPASDLPDVHEMASTALMHALMQSYCYASAEDIFDQQRAYTARLRRHAVSEEVSAERFFALFAALKELLISGGLSSNSRWLQAARLWQCVLAAVPCQAGAGVQWAPTPGVALALLALRPRSAVGPTPQPGGIMALAMRLQTWAAFAASVLAGGVVTGGFSAGEQQTTLSHIYARKPATEPSGRASLAVEDSANIAAAGKLAGGEGPPHPLSPAFDFDAVAMLREAPDCLGSCPELWITACVAEVLGSLEVGWAPEGFPSLAHAAAAGADAMLASAQAAGAKLSAAELSDAAHLAVSRWATAYELSVVRTRAAAVVDAKHHGNVVRRSMGSLALQLATQHPTFGPLTSPEFVCARRWIAFSAIGAGVIAGLTCSIWIFWRVSSLWISCAPRCHRADALSASAGPRLWCAALRFAARLSATRAPPTCPATATPAPALTWRIRTTALRPRAYGSQPPPPRRPTGWRGRRCRRRRWRATRGPATTTRRTSCCRASSPPRLHCPPRCSSTRRCRCRSPPTRSRWRAAPGSCTGASGAALRWAGRPGRARESGRACCTDCGSSGQGHGAAPWAQRWWWPPSKPQ